MGNSWFLSFGAAGSPRLRLVCFPFAGGSPAAFRSWASRLHGASEGAIEVVAVQAPGRGSRFGERPLVSLGAMADAIADALPALGRAPLAFFGHSMGAHVAFEVARRLRRRGAPLPVQLVVSGARAPQLEPRPRGWHLLGDRALACEIERLGGTPAEVLQNPELLAIVLPLLRADFQALDTHVHEPEPPLEVPLRAFGGLADLAVPFRDLDAWGAQSTHPVTTKSFPGGHFFLESARERVLAELSAVLERYLLDRPSLRMRASRPSLHEASA